MKTQILLIVSCLISTVLAQKPGPEPTPAVGVFLYQEGRKDPKVLATVMDKELFRQVGDDEAIPTPTPVGDVILTDTDRRTVSLPFTVRAEKIDPSTPLDLVFFKVDGIDAKIDKVYPYTLTIGEEWKLKEGENHTLEVTPVALIKNVAVSGKTISWSFITPDLPSPSPTPTPIEENK